MQYFPVWFLLSHYFGIAVTKDYLSSVYYYCMYIHTGYTIVLKVPKPSKLSKYSCKTFGQCSTDFFPQQNHHRCKILLAKYFLLRYILEPVFYFFYLSKRVHSVLLVLFSFRQISILLLKYFNATSTNSTTATTLLQWPFPQFMTWTCNLKWNHHFSHHGHFSS